MKFSAKISDCFYPLTISWKDSILDVWLVDLVVFLNPPLIANYNVRMRSKLVAALTSFFLFPSLFLLISWKTSENLWFSKMISGGIQRRDQLQMGLVTSNSKNHEFGSLVLKPHTTFAGFFQPRCSFYQSHVQVKHRLLSVRSVMTALLFENRFQSVRRINTKKPKLNLTCYLYLMGFLFLH